MDIDTNRPSPARIYDYWLGGTHNFPVDREVGKQVVHTLPFGLQALNLNRWFVGYAGRRMGQAGIEHFLDLGAGLPTEGSLHTAVPDRSKVLYVDYDPDAVAYSQQILRDELGSPAHILYMQGKIEEIEPILTTAAQFFDSKSSVGICLIGVAWFLNEVSLRQTFQRLYDWSAPGSMLAVSSGETDPSDPRQRSSIESYQQRTGTNLYLPPMSEFIPLIEPWQPLEGGLKPFEAYAEADLGTTVVQPDFRGKVGYAGFFTRPG